MRSDCKRSATTLHAGLVLILCLAVGPASAMEAPLQERLGLAPAGYPGEDGDWAIVPGPYLEIDGRLYVPTLRRRLQQQQTQAGSGVTATPYSGSRRPAHLNAIEDVLINDPAGQSVNSGNTQTNPSIAASGDTLVCVYSDSEGLYQAGESAIGYSFSLDGGGTWTDGGSLPLVGSGGTEMLLEDATVCTDGAGRWYVISIYDVGNGAGDFGTGDLGLALSRGTFVAGNMAWSTPWNFVGGDTEGSVLQWPDAALDVANDRLYVTYTNISIPETTGFGQVEVVTLSNQATTVENMVVLQPEIPEENNGASRVAVGVNGELFCVWASDLLGGGFGQGPAQVMLSRSQDLGASFDPAIQAGTIIESWFNNPPGSNDEDFNIAFPSIQVDHHPGPNFGRVYLAWHDGVEMVYATTMDTIPETESNDTVATATMLPNSTEDWFVQSDMPPGDSADYFRFEGVSGEHFRAIVKGTSGLYSWRLTLWCDTQNTDHPDTLLAASERGSFEGVFALLTLPYTGTYYLRLENLWPGVTPTYRAYFRKTSTTLPSVATDHRDIVVVTSADGMSGWSSKVRVNDDTLPADQAWPALRISSGGLHVAWYDRRNDPICRVLANTMLSSSFDAGNTFTPNLRLSQQSSWWQVPSDALPNFGPMRIETGGHRLYVPWADGRLGDADIRFSSFQHGFVLMVPDSVVATSPGTLGMSIDILNGLIDADTVDVEISSFCEPELASESFGFDNLLVEESRTHLYDPVVDAGIHDVAPCSLLVRAQSRKSGQIVEKWVQVVSNGTVPVFVANWSSTWIDGALQIRWKSDPSVRFHLHRGRSPEGPYARATSVALGNDKGLFEFTDVTAEPGESYYYRLEALEAAGEPTFHGPFLAETATPSVTRLLGAYPNPFNPSTRIDFVIPRERQASLRLLDTRGRLVRHLLQQHTLPAGRHSVFWDGRGDSSRPMPSGVYFAELSTGSERLVTRLVLVR